MSIYALSDLHLPGSDDKPMDIFGEQWDNHWEKIRENWKRQIKDRDIALIPGDISWAMTLNEALEDLDMIDSLPGTKIILKGNHDYWWGSISRVREVLPAGMMAVQNDSIRIGNVVICGTRGWLSPGASDFDQNDEKLYMRESQRLALSLKHAEKQKQPGDKLVVMMHYPPFGPGQKETLFTNTLEQAAPDVVVYGHLHGVEKSKVFEGELRGVTYKMVACDHVNFSPVKIL